MPRITRSAVKTSPEAKENVDTEAVQQKSKRKSPKSSKSDEDGSSPTKLSRSSSSMSPLGDQFETRLKLSSPGSKYRSARRALVGNSEFRLPGRENEFDELSKYLNNLIETEGSGSLYISGAPGNFFAIFHINRTVHCRHFRHRQDCTFIENRQPPGSQVAPQDWLHQLHQHQFNRLDL